MKLRCSSCNFELNLSIKSLPKNAKLYCPKCKAVLTSVEETSSSAVQPDGMNAAPEQTDSQQIAPQIPGIIETPRPPPTKENIPPAVPLQTNSSGAQELFSEDLKPEFEMQSEEVIQKTREELFSKPEQVWYDGAVQPPPIQPQVAVPPPIPTNIPPPIPMNIPPPIPSSSSAPQSGYISASSSIQIDSSLIVSGTPEIPSSTPVDSPIPIPKEEKIELVSEVITPPLSTPTPEAKDISQVDEKAEKIKTESPKDKSDVILLTPQTYKPKRISITLPAISLIVLAGIAGFIYYQIVVSSSKSELIKDLKSTPALGAIPSVNSTAQNKTEPNKTNSTDTQDTSTTKNNKIPIKAKKSALEHYKKGNQYFMETKFDQARDEYAMAVAADPTFGLAYRGLGTTYAKLGQPDLAVKNYEKYIELSPNATDAEQVKSIIKQYYGK